MDGNINWLERNAQEYWNGLIKKLMFRTYWLSESKDTVNYSRRLKTSRLITEPRWSIFCYLFIHCVAELLQRWCRSYIILVWNPLSHTCEVNLDVLFTLHMVSIHSFFTKTFFTTRRYFITKTNLHLLHLAENTHVRTQPKCWGNAKWISWRQFQGDSWLY